MRADVSGLCARMNRLSPRHRLAHLRALIRCEPDGTNRHELVALLRDQLATLHAKTKPARYAPSGRSRESAIAASAELAAYVARRTT